MWNIILSLHRLIKDFFLKLNLSYFFSKMSQTQTILIYFEILQYLHILMQLSTAGAKSLYSFLRVVKLRLHSTILQLVPLFTNSSLSHSEMVQRTPRDTAGYFQFLRETQYFVLIGYHMNYQLKVIHSFSKTHFFSKVSSLQSKAFYSALVNSEFHMKQKVTVVAS